MFDLLKIEWLKIKKYNTFWIVSGLFLVLIAIANYFVIAGFMQTGNKGVSVLGEDHSFSNVWNKVSYITKIFSGLLAVIIIILTTNEYQFKTNRQNVIDGWRKIDFFHAKWGVTVLLSIIITLYAVLQGLCFGVAGGSSLSSIGNNFDSILYVFLLTLNYFGLALTASFFLKRSGMTIIIFLVYGYIIELMIDKFLSTKLHSDLGKYLPMDSSANLLPVSKMESMTSMMINSSASTNALIITSVVWIVIYYFAGRVRLLRSDW